MLTRNRSQILPLPPHYDPGKVGEVWRVPYQDRALAAQEWAAQYAIQPTSEDHYKVALIVIDVQNTFCLPDFELFVAGRSGTGAVEDNRRLCEFIYHNLNVITNFVLTMDTHRVMQIFHPIYLVDSQGEHPSPHTLVTYDDVREGRWRFNAAIAENIGISAQDGQEHLLYYTRQLKERGKYDLTIWPYHAMLGGIGHALVSAVEEAVFFHAIARNSQPSIIIKGESAITESYSAIGPEVRTRSHGEQIAAKNDAFLSTVIQHNRIYFAGQAKSHCVAWTVADLLDEIRQQDASLAQKIYLLEDCTSPVVVPGVIDYTDQADDIFQSFARAGMHIVRSTEPHAGN